MSVTEKELLVVLCTFPSSEVAGRVARTLVDERLCACVNLQGEVRSIYRWQGSVQDEAEVLCLIKTTADRFPALSERLRALHPYEVPEIVALKAHAVSDSYLAWAAAQTEAG